MGGLVDLWSIKKTVALALSVKEVVQWMVDRRQCNDLTIWSSVSWLNELCC